MEGVWIVALDQFAECETISSWGMIPCCQSIQSHGSIKYSLSLSHLAMLKYL